MSVKVSNNIREVVWVPEGYTFKKVARIQDGMLYEFPVLEGYLVESDTDGCIEFIQNIRQALIDTGG